MHLLELHLDFARVQFCDFAGLCVLTFWGWRGRWFIARLFEGVQRRLWNANFVS